MIKKITAFITAAAMACMLPLTALAKTVENEVSVPPKIVVLGDSIAAGYGLEGFSEDRYSCDSYANILYSEYKKELPDDCPTDLANLSVVGDTSQQLLDHLQNKEFDDKLKDSDCVIISIGGNDILGLFLDFLMNDLGITPDTTTEELLDKTKDIMGIAMDMKNMSDDMDKALSGFGDRLNSVIDYINTQTDATIIMQTLYDPLDNFTQGIVFQSMSKEKITKLNKIITDNATDENGKERYLVADVYSEFSGHGTEFTNITKYDIHPNKDGHTLIASCIDKVIRTKTYTYTTQVPDSDKLSKKDITIIAVSAAACAAIIVAVIVTIKHKKKG